MDSHPNDVVPRELVDSLSSYDFIEQYMKHYLRRAASLAPNQNLEIEAKLGYDFRTTDQTVGKADLVRQLSGQDYIILNCTERSLDLNTFFKWGYNITPGLPIDNIKIPEEHFRRSLKYFEIESKKHPEKMWRPGPKGADGTRLLIDFSNTKGRVSYDCYNQKWGKVKKGDRSNLDFCHKANIIRITGSIEEMQDLEEEDIELKEFDSVRIKLRDVFHFQFMEYSFTEVYTVSQASTDSDAISVFEKIINKLTTVPKHNRVFEIMQYITPLRFSKQEQYEIEVEIFNPKFLLERERDPMAFSSLIKRFLRNVEAITHVPRLLYTNISRDFLKAEGTKVPEISHYLPELYDDYVTERAARK